MKLFIHFFYLNPISAVLASNYTISNTIIHVTGTMQLCRVGNSHSTGSKDWTLRFKMYVLASWQIWLGLQWKHTLIWIQDHLMWPIFMSSIMDGGIWFIITVVWWMGMWTWWLCMDNSERWWHSVMSETGYRRWFYLQKQDAWNFRDFFGRSFYSFHFSFIFILYIRQEVAMVPEKRVISTVIGLK